MLMAGDTTRADTPSAEAAQECDVEELILQILRKAAEKPEEVNLKLYFTPFF